MIRSITIVLLAVAVPLSAAAATFKDIVGGTDTGIVHVIDASLVPLLYAIAFLMFLFGVFRFFFTPSEEARAKGKQFVIWGIIGFVVLFSVWGLVKLLLSALTGGA